MKSILSLDRSNNSLALTDIDVISPYKDYLDIKAGKEPGNFILWETTQVIDSVCTVGQIRGMNTADETAAIEFMVNVQVGDTVMDGIIKYTDPAKGRYSRWGYVVFSDQSLSLGPNLINRYGEDCAKVRFTPKN